MVESDRWFVEHIQNAAQFRSNLRRQPDALPFAAGQRGGGAAERQVAKSDIVEELQALGDLVKDP